MVDMRATIIPKSDRINFDDFLAGPGTVTIKDVALYEENGEVKGKLSLEECKPWHPCKSMMRVLIGAWGPDGSEYIGRKLTLYGDPEVKFGGAKVGGIRISHMSHIELPWSGALTATKGKKAMFTVQPLVEVNIEFDPAVLDDARSAAMQGTEALREWWSKAGGRKQHMLKDEMNGESGLKALAAQADKDLQAGQDPDPSLDQQDEADETTDQDFSGV